MDVIVPDEFLSIAIGKRGQNVRLASKLTGWHIDVQSESSYSQTMQDGYESLMALPGVGVGLADALYENGFFSVEEISTVSIEDLKQIKGIGEGKAQKLIEAAEQAVIQKAEEDAQEEDAQEEDAQEEDAQEEDAQEEDPQEEDAQEEDAQEEDAQEEDAQEEDAQEEDAQEEDAQEEGAQEEDAQEEGAQEEDAQEEGAQEEDVQKQDVDAEDAADADETDDKKASSED